MFQHFGKLFPKQYPKRYLNPLAFFFLSRKSFPGKTFYFIRNNILLYKVIPVRFFFLLSTLSTHTTQPLSEDKSETEGIFLASKSNLPVGSLLQLPVRSKQRKNSALFSNPLCGVNPEWGIQTVRWWRSPNAFLRPCLTSRKCGAGAGEFQHPKGTLRCTMRYHRTEQMKGHRPLAAAGCWK